MELFLTMVYYDHTKNGHDHTGTHKALFFLILGLQIFFQNVKVGGGEKKKKLLKKIFLFNLKHIWIGEKK